MTPKSNDAENSVLRHRNKFDLKIYYNRKLMLEIAIRFQNITVFSVFVIE